MQNRNNDMEEIDLLEIAALLIRRIWIIAVSGVITGLIAFAISAFILTPQYDSTTKVYILNRSDPNGTISYSDTQLASQLTKDYKEIVTCRYVLERVIQLCSLNTTYEGLKDRVSVSNTTDTRIIGITVRDANPSTAQYIANSIRIVASDHIEKVMDIETVNVVDEANLPDKPTDPSIMKWTAMGVFLGAVAAMAVIVVLFLLDDTIKTSEDVEKYLGLSTLALIPVMQGETRKSSHNRKREQAMEQKYMQPALKKGDISVEEL